VGTGPYRPQGQNRGLAAHTAKTLRCHANWPRRRVSARPLDTRAFCCWKIEAAQGWNGRVSATFVIAAKCRRLGGSLATGLQPAQKNARFSTSCSASFLNAAYWLLNRTVSVSFGFALLLPLARGRLGGSKAKITETARSRCLKTAVKNGAEQEVQDLRLESRSEGTA